MFHELAPTSSSSLGSTHHVEAAGRAESELAEGGKKNKKAKGGGEKKKKALKKTELAKLYFKVGWHIRGTSSYTSAFLRDIYALVVPHPKRAFSLKPSRLRPNIHRRAPRPNYPFGSQTVEPGFRGADASRGRLHLKIIKCDMISAVIYIHIMG